MRRSRGQAMVELICALPVLLMLLLGIIELAFGYRAFITLQYATQEAARLAAMNNAQYPAMRKGLVNGMAPLFVGTSPVENDFSNESKALSAAFERAEQEVDEFMRVTRINPSPDIFDGSDKNALVVVLDPMGAPITDTPALQNRRLIFDGKTRVGKAALTLQDANLLKILVEYCYELKTPVWRTILPKVIGVKGSPEEGRKKNSLGESIGLAKYCNERKGLMLTADATTRMQSDAFKRCSEREFIDGEALVCYEPAAAQN